MESLAPKPIKEKRDENDLKSSPIKRVAPLPLLSLAVVAKRGSCCPFATAFAECLRRLFYRRLCPVGTPPLLDVFATTLIEASPLHQSKRPIEVYCCSSLIGDQKCKSSAWISSQGIVAMDISSGHNWSRKSEGIGRSTVLYSCGSVRRRNNGF